MEQSSYAHDDSSALRKNASLTKLNGCNDKEPPHFLRRLGPLRGRRDKVVFARVRGREGGSYPNNGQSLSQPSSRLFAGEEGEGGMYLRHTRSTKSGNSGMVSGGEEQGYFSSGRTRCTSTRLCTVGEVHFLYGKMQRRHMRKRSTRRRRESLRNRQKGAEEGGTKGGCVACCDRHQVRNFQCGSIARAEQDETKWLWRK